MSNTKFGKMVNCHRSQCMWFKDNQCTRDLVQIRSIGCKNYSLKGDWTPKKVLLFGCGYNPGALLHNGLKETLQKKDFPENRTGEIVEYIEKHGTLVEHTTNRYIYKLYDNYYQIEVVDITRPWTIMEYDSQEYIQYLDSTLINEKLNFHKLTN